MCGISSVSLKKDLTPSQLELVSYKMKILALYNESRGKTGCGIYINNQRLMPSGTTSLISDFLGTTKLPAIDLKKSSSIMIHSRQASVGGNVITNNHPFHIKTGRPLFIVHNGTLSQMHQLGESLQIKWNEWTVDSELLGIAIAQGNMEQVLTNYLGKAVLCWVYEDAPDELYTFKGLSKEFPESTASEERPLYFLEQPEGVYFSSIAKSLSTINCAETYKVLALGSNQVIRWKYGVPTVIGAPIQRENKVVPLRTDTYGNPYKASTTNSKVAGTQISLPLPKLISTSKVLFEDIPTKAVNVNTSNNGFVYFHKGRYWEIPLDGSVETAVLAHGRLVVTEKGEVLATGDNYWFFKGVLLKTSKDFTDITTFHSKRWLTPSVNFAKEISAYSLHPVTNLEESSEVLLDQRCRWYQNYTQYTGNFKPKFASRQYFFINGELTEIKPFQKNDTPLPNPEKQKKEETAFNVVFNDVADFWINATETELNALDAYIEDIFGENDKELPEGDLEVLLNTILEGAIANKITVQDYLNLTDEELNMYLTEETDTLIDSAIQDYVEDAVAALNTLREAANALQVLQDSDIAQEFAFTLYQGIDTIRTGLLQKADNTNFKNLVKDLIDDIVQ